MSNQDDVRSSSEVLDTASQPVLSGDSAHRSPASALPYALVDVFAERALEGNMLAVFHDAGGLTAEQMQALARETNLAETTFVFPRDEATEAAQGVKVRIFTTQEELRFAGHPTLGTAAWLNLHHPRLAGQRAVTLDLPVGPIKVEFEAPEPGREGIFGTMRQGDPVFGSTHNREAIAAATGIPLADLDDRYPVQTVSTGMPFCIVLLRSAEALSRVAIPQPLAQAYLARSDAKFFYCLSPANGGSEIDFHARMQFYSGEDPATGSAAGCAISYLVARGLRAPGEPTVLAQGDHIGRPSRIHVRAGAPLSGASPAASSAAGQGPSDGSLQAPAALTGVFVGGRTIPVASGSFFRV